MRSDFAAALAATYGDPSAFSELVFGTPLNKAQRRYTRDAHGQVNFLLPGNSAGKTELILRFALYMAWHKVGPQRLDTFEGWFKQRYQGLVASYNYGVAEESFSRLQDARDTREEVAALVTDVNISKSRATLANGAVIMWGSLDDKGKLVEAKRTNFIFVDEVGHIPNLSYTYDSVLYPRTLGVGGVIHLFGTPKPTSDPYLMEIAEKGKEGGDGYYFSQGGSVFENEYWPEDEKERVLKNPRYVRGWVACKGCDDEVLCFPDLGGHPILTPMGRQVFLGAFVLEGGLFFNRLHVARIFAWDGLEPEWLGEDHFAMPPRPGRMYMAAFDLAGNKLRKYGTKRAGSDPTVGFVIDYTDKPWRIVRYDYIRGGEADWQEKYTLMEEVYRTYNLPYLLIDATGNLDSVVEALQQRGVEVEGISFGGASARKLDMLRNLQLCMEMDWGYGDKGVLRSPLIPKLKHELEHYVLPDDHIEQDCVMALCMVVHHCAMNDMPDAVYGEVY